MKKSNAVYAVLIFAVAVMFIGYIQNEYLPPEKPLPKHPLQIQAEALSGDLYQANKQNEFNQLAIDELIKTNQIQESDIEKLKEYNRKLTAGEVTRNVDYILSDKIDKAILKASQKYNVESALIRAVIKQESQFHILAVSTAGAQGLMQLMPDTARLLRVSNVWDIEQNIDGGTRFLKDQLVEFGDLKLALAAYNAGPNAVKRYRGIPPYRETQDYVKKVIYNYNLFK